MYYTFSAVSRTTPTTFNSPFNLNQDCKAVINNKDGSKILLCKRKKEIHPLRIVCLLALPAIAVVFRIIFNEEDVVDRGDGKSRKIVRSKL